MPPAVPTSEARGLRLAEALDRLIAAARRDLDALPSRAGDRVHNIRVDMKKVRALLLLGRPVLGRDLQKRTSRLARNVKNRFGSLRDVAVLRELLLDLLPRAKAEAAIRRLGLDDVAPVLVAADHSAAPLLDELSRAVHDAPPARWKECDVTGGWISTYRACRRAEKTCRRNGSDAKFHRLRKHVKELLYQSEVLADVSAVLKRIPAAEKLSSLLGKHHDLSMLCERLETSRPASPVSGIARRRKALVTRRALKLAAGLFDQKPSALRRRLA